MIWSGKESHDVNRSHLPLYRYCSIRPLYLDDLDNCVHVGEETVGAVVIGVGYSDIRCTIDL